MPRRTLSPSQQEYQLQVQICDYLRWRYPDVIFRSDLGGIRLTMGQAVKVKRIQAGRAFPDLFLAEARLHYHGLMMEIKVDRSAVFTKSGELRQDEHIQEQAAMLEALTRRGYFAVWGLGFDESRAMIDMYLLSEAK